MKSPSPCPYNIGVICDQKDRCRRCGWNPEEEKRRKACLGPPAPYDYRENYRFGWVKGSPNSFLNGKSRKGGILL